MIMLLILGSAIGTVAFAGVALAGSVAKAGSSRERELKTYWALSGAVERAKADLVAGRLAIGESRSYLVGARSVNVEVLDNEPTLKDTVKLELTGAENGKTYGKSVVLALPKAVVTGIWSHGIFSNTGFTWPAASSVEGSVYFRNSISVLSTGGRITKDFKTTSMFNPMGLITVDGAILTGLKPYTWPTISATGYLDRADAVLTGNQTLAAYTFPIDGGLTVVNGNLNLNNATITRSGTLFVTGTVTLNRLSKANPADHVAIVTPNGITFLSTAGSVSADAYFFSGSTITIGSPVNIKGAMVASSFTVKKPLTVIWDPWIMADPENGKAIRAPGLWP